MVRALYCRYDKDFNIEHAQGALRIYIPSADGYINYNIVHTVNERINANVWRIGQAYTCDDALIDLYPITPEGAEWDMAIKLQGRNDFIGGAAHGDEIYTFISVYIDSNKTDIYSIEEVLEFSEISISQTSTGYDPDDHMTKALVHQKEYLINKNGIVLKQFVEWLNDYELGASYMAMMPPSKAVTDIFYTDIEPDAVAIEGRYVVNNARSAVVLGVTSGFIFSMSIPQYPNLLGGNRFLLTDNKGGLYNKMYFVICDGARVCKHDFWETVTHYQIHKNFDKN